MRAHDEKLALSFITSRLHRDSSDHLRLPFTLPVQLVLILKKSYILAKEEDD